MKNYVCALVLTLLFTACGASEQNRVSNTVQTNQTDRTGVLPPAPTTTPTPVASSARPIEFTYLGITPDKERLHYRIKVLTATPISQVDLGVRYTGVGGEVLDDTTLLWQNIVKSTRKPIEKGKTYEVEDYLPEGTIKAEVVLKRVVFEDLTYWEPE